MPNSGIFVNLLCLFIICCTRRLDVNLFDSKSSVKVRPGGAFEEEMAQTVNTMARAGYNVRNLMEIYNCIEAGVPELFL